MLIGIIAGLIPGLHSNNIAVIISASPYFGIEICAFVLSMCTVQVFIEFIPSTFLGATSEATFESVLPAHRMLLEGKAYEAICLTTLGAIIAFILGAILTPWFFAYLETNSQEIIQITPIVLIFALIVFPLSEKGWKNKLTSIFVIIAAGTQGYLFNGQIFPLITGYFGIAGTIYSLKEENYLQKQTLEVKIKLNEIKNALVGMIGGAIVAVMPGIGSNTAGGIINIFRKNTDSRGYLTMLGAINASNFFFSFATLFALSKARNGGMLAIKDKIFATPAMMTYGTEIMLISAGIGGFIAILIAKKATQIIKPTLVKKLGIITIIFMIILVGVINGAIGLIALFFSTALGLFTISSKIRRSTMMASLIVPVLFFYIFILT